MIRDIILLICLGFLSSIGTAGQKTEIVIVGTVHSETPNYRIQDLVNILKRVKPDVILFEMPADMMTSSFEFKTILKDSPEQQAVMEYVRQTGAKIRPYDIEGRNAFYQRSDFNSQDKRCNSELLDFAYKNKLNSKAQMIFETIIAANNKSLKILKSDPELINSFESDSAINERYWLIHQGIPEIARLTPGLHSCAPFWDLSRAEWIHRNNRMVENIKKYSIEFAGQRLVVICGYEHRYYLRSHLYDWRDETPGYVIKEYWQY